MSTGLDNSHSPFESIEAELGKKTCAIAWLLSSAFVYSLNGVFSKILDERGVGLD